jgi:hypothetical protein
MCGLITYLSGQGMMEASAEHNNEISGSGPLNIEVILLHGISCHHHHRIA